MTVLGCDGSWPGPGGAGSGYLVRTGRATLLVDAGPGTFATLQRLVDPALVDGIVLTHHHPDHWSDLHWVATQARFGQDRSAEGRDPIPVFAPATLADRTDLTGSPVLGWHLVTGGDTVTVAGITCTFRRTAHVHETLAVRLDGGGRSLGYSADTGPEWPLSELGTGLDLVLAEATYTADHEGTAGHMSGRQAGEQAARAGAHRLVITHPWPTLDAGAVAAEATATFGRPVDQAVIGKECSL